MKSVSNDFKNQIKSLGREISAIITYTEDEETKQLDNSDINIMSIHYEGGLLKSVMKQLDIDSNVDIPLETVINAQFGVKVEDEYEYIDYGSFVVYSSEKQEDTGAFKIIAYDKLLYSMIDYETPKINGTPISFPITIRDYINAICSHLGLTFKNASDTFTNYNKQIPNELYLDTEGNTLGYTFRDVLDELAQVTASTICLDDNDELEIRYINDTQGNNLFPNSDTFDYPNWNVGGTILTDVTKDGSYSVRTRNAWDGPYVRVKELYDNGKINVGDVVTYSIYFKTNFAPTKDFQITMYRSVNGTIPRKIYSQNEILPDVWYRVEFTYTIDEYSITRNDMRIECDYFDSSDPYYFGNDRTNFVYFSQPKYEKNDHATTYVQGNLDMIDEEYLKDINVNFGEKYGPINTVSLKRGAGSDVISKSIPENLPDDEKIEISISGNQIMNGNNRAEYRDEILNRLYGLEFYINDFDSTGIAYLDLCDRYNVKIADKFYSCIMFNDELNIEQGISERIYTDMPEESKTDYSKADKTDRKLNNVSLTVDKHSLEIEALSEKIVDVSETKNGIGSITLENAYPGTLHNLVIKGQISQLFPQNENDLYGNVPFGNEIHYPSNSLYTQVSILIIDDEEYNLDLDFLNYINSDVCDEFVYEDGKCQIIRRVGIDSNGEKYELENEIIEEREDILLEVDTNSTITLKSFGNAIMSSTYLLQNEYTDVFTTNVDLISRINLAPGTAEIEARKISLFGKDIDLTGDEVTITSNNFNVDSNGNATMSTATITNGILKIGNNEIFNTNGVLNTMIVNGVVSTPRLIFGGDFCPMGNYWDGSNDYTKEHISFSFIIPDNFTILSAFIILQHEPLISNEYNTTTTGCCKNLALYEGSLSSSSKKYMDWNVGFIGNANTYYSIINNAWKNIGTTFSGNTNSITNVTSIDLKNYLEVGANHFVIMSTNGSTSVNLNDYGAVLAQLYVTGYTKLE